MKRLGSNVAYLRFLTFGKKLVAGNAGIVLVIRDRS